MTGRSKQGKGGKWRPMLYDGEKFIGMLGGPHGFDTKAEADAFGMKCLMDRAYWESDDGLVATGRREWR